MKIFTQIIFNVKISQSTVYGSICNCHQMFHQVDSAASLSCWKLLLTVCCVHLPFQVICGLNHTLCLGKDSKVYACGWSTDGQTGILPCSFYTLSNTFPINMVPVPISLLLSVPPHTLMQVWAIMRVFRN